jgi:hypothetical protein
MMIIIIIIIIIIIGIYLIYSEDYCLPISLAHWFPACGTRTPGGTRRVGWEYAKIILAIEENTKKRS